MNYTIISTKKGRKWEGMEVEFTSLPGFRLRLVAIHDGDDDSYVTNDWNITPRNIHHCYEQRWDKEKEKRVKVSKYIGRVTSKGIKTRDTLKIRGSYEYGNVCLLNSLAKSSKLSSRLEEVFGADWESMLVFAMNRVINPLPLKSVQSWTEKTYLSKELTNLHISPKSLSSLLKRIGVGDQLRFFRLLLKERVSLIYDLSFILSQSQSLLFAERGYNKDHLFLPQVNLALGFSHPEKLPAFLRIVPGSVRDISTLVNSVEEMGLSRGIMVTDTGFFSRTNLEHLIKRGLSFIIPCKRNSRLVPQITVLSKNFFMYRGRAIKHTETEAEELHLYLFEDTRLGCEEETTYYTLIEQGKRKFKEGDMKNFGRISLLSDLADSPQQIYLMYKSREEIEVAFNLLKNVMEVDRTYLRDNESLSGYLFINFISLYLYYFVLNLLQKEELNSKLSVRDLLLELSKIYVVESEGKELISGIPKKANCLIQLLGYDLFPKLRES